MRSKKRNMRTKKKRTQRRTHKRRTQKRRTKNTRKRTQKRNKISKRRKNRKNIIKASMDQSVEVKRPFVDVTNINTDTDGRTLKRRNSVARDVNVRKIYVSKVPFSDLYSEAALGESDLFSDHISFSALNRYEDRKRKKNLMGYPVWAETMPQFFERLLFNHFELTEVAAPELGAHYNTVDGIKLGTNEPYEFKYIDPEKWYTNEPRKNCREVNFMGKGHYIPELFHTENLSKSIEEYVVGKTSVEENEELNNAAKMIIHTSERQLNCLNEGGMIDKGGWYYNTGGMGGEVSGEGHLIIGTIGNNGKENYIQYISIPGSEVYNYLDPLT